MNDELKDVVAQKLKNVDTRVVYAGFDENSEIRAENIAVSENGSTFDLIVENERYVAKTRLIGLHNVKNLLLAVGVAYGLGVEIPYILQGIEQEKMTLDLKKHVPIQLCVQANPDIVSLISSYEPSINLLFKVKEVIYIPTNEEYPEGYHAFNILDMTL